MIPLDWNEVYSTDSLLLVIFYADRELDWTRDELNVVMNN